MRPVANRGVTLTERGAPASSPDWEHIHIFLRLHDEAVFVQRRNHLGISYGSVQRHIDELEHQLGAKRFYSTRRGCEADARGPRIVGAAEQMETAFFGLMRARERAVAPYTRRGQTSDYRGIRDILAGSATCRVSTSPSETLRRSECAMQSADVLRLEARCLSPIDRAQSADLKVVSLAEFTSVPFAARSYIYVYGRPKTRRRASKPSFVFNLRNKRRTQEIYDHLFPGVPQSGFVALADKHQYCPLWAIAKGAGIGWSPTYVARWEHRWCH